jgi:hypothetical protein
MTQDEIIEMARQAGIRDSLEYDHMECNIESLEAFAKLVAAKEREACAKVCAEDKVQAMDFTGVTFVGGYFANKILARGEQA